MIRYFERQLAEFERSIYSLDEKLFERWVNEAVATLRAGHKIIVSEIGRAHV